MASNTPRPTKAERREAARVKAQALREEQERRERRAKITRRVLIGAGAVVAVGGATGLVVASQMKKSDLPTGTIAEGKANTPGVPEIVLSDGAWTYGKDSGLLGGQGVAIGSVTEGAAVLDVFFDYSCPHCAEFDSLHTDEITKLLDNGEATLVLHPCKILGQDWTDLAMNAMGLVIDKDPDNALAFHNAVFEEYLSIAQKQDASRLTVETLVSVGEKAGVSGEVTAQFKDTITSRAYDAWTKLGTETFQNLGFKGTPTILVRGEQIDLTQVGAADSLTKLIINK